MDRQNSANEVAEIDTAMATLGKEPVDFVITPQMQAWIDYNAMSGIITDNMEEGTDPATGQAKSLRKMPITEFAELIGIHRDTLRNWRTYIPNFWDRVNERRKELAPHARLQNMHERWYLNALKMQNWPLVESWLINFDPGYESPKLKVEHELGDGVADALNVARERRMKAQTVVEAEIVDGTADA
jgi:hypothetical protein